MFLLTKYQYYIYIFSPFPPLHFGPAFSVLAFSVVPSTVGDRAFPVAAARHVCTLAACFSQSSEDASLQTLLSVTPSSVFCRACEVTRHNRTR